MFEVIRRMAQRIGYFRMSLEQLSDQLYQPKCCYDTAGPTMASDLTVRHVSGIRSVRVRVRVNGVGK